MKTPKTINTIIVSLFITTTFFWLLSDMTRLLPTPLSHYGMSHWIPELLLVFAIGYSIVDNQKISKSECDIITIILFLYPLIYYGIMGHNISEYIFGIGASCIFSGFFLFGIWYGEKRHQTKFFNQVYDIISPEGQI